MQHDETIYKQSFKLPPAVSTKCKPVVIPELKFVQPRAYHFIDVSSLTPYQVNKGVHIPFDIFWAPKPIVGESPKYTLFQYNPPVESKEKVKMTSVLSPCTLLEEADNEKTYQTIIDNMYLSTKSKGDQDIEKLCQRRDIPDTYVYNANPITFNSKLYEQLPEKYIEAGKEWDNKNVRWLSDRDKYFWDKFNQEKQNKLPNAYHEKNLIKPEMKEKIRKLLCKNELRQAHQTYKHGYGGFKPYAAWGVPIEKNNLPVDHPFVSITSAVYKYKK